MITDNLKSTNKHEERLEALEEFTHYRLTSVGEALKDTLDEMVEANAFTEENKEAALRRFDRVFPQILHEQPQKTFKFKGKVQQYKNVEDVWMFVVKDLSMKVDTSQVVVRNGPSKIVCILRR